MFVSLSFLELLIVSVFIFYILKGEKRVYFLSLASLLYCFYLDKYAAIVVVLTSLMNYAGGRILYLMENKKRNVMLWCMLGMDIGILCLYKYGMSFLQRIGYEDVIGENYIKYFLIPLGLSFYLFQAMSYLVDVAQEKCKSERNYLYFLLYMCFFTKFVSGPIERMEMFKERIEGIKYIRFWNPARLSAAFTFILYGYFMKVVLADRIVITVNKIFDAPSNYGRFWLIIGVVLYSIYIYTDFAGYSYIAVGASKLFGIDININFRNPYFAGNITEFWRRWHISLSSWLKSYIYIPLGGNRAGKIKKCRNVLVVFIICGLWHGQGMNFLIWGILHGIYSVADMIIKVENKLVRHGIVLMQVSFAWLFFGVSSFSAAVRYLWNFVKPENSAAGILQGYRILEWNQVELWIICLGVLFVFFMEFWSETKGEIVPISIQHLTNAKRYIIFYFLIISIIIFGIYGRGYDASNFVYMQF